MIDLNVHLVLQVFFCAELNLKSNSLQIILQTRLYFINWLIITCVILYLYEIALLLSPRNIFHWQGFPCICGFFKLNINSNIFLIILYWALNHIILHLNRGVIVKKSNAKHLIYCIVWKNQKRMCEMKLNVPRTKKNHR